MRERILVGGNTGSGKTHGWLTIAQAFPDLHFHVIDPEDGVDRTRIGFPNKDHPVELKNITYYATPQWLGEVAPETPGSKDRFVGGVTGAFARIKSTAKPGDWVVVEAMGAMWDMAQDGFVGAIWDKGIGEYFLERRKAQEEQEQAIREGKLKGKVSSRLDAMDGWKDWLVIKKLHNSDFIIPICTRLPVHSYFTTSMSVTSKAEAAKEDPDIQSMYGETLIRYEGEKRNPFRVQTGFIFSGNKRDAFFMTTFLKEWSNRAWMTKVPLHNFALQYLVAVGGWKFPGGG